MKFLLAAVFALGFYSSAVADESHAGYSRTRNCSRNEYREEYFPGTEDSPGYVKSWTESVEVPCGGGHGHSHSHSHSPTVRSPIPQNVDTNDCSDGKIAGGLLGGAAGAAMSRGSGRWWAIPIGAVAGSAIGCEAAGG